ncbi:ParA family protein [Roseospira marina]|uniref:ParA family protein n=1 Tax=Roseospira marina TaxID=140057 RepID=A0A5M6I9D5_9PROT|nr:ParA family partition ATPase [Roseospira marina]KAA5604793.1 ParA family protein [Roseospira marina]MBB4313482.1 chromosome partitioning protein [Roseospira marina]MBB5086644.1 chromosome partitioning protein [Roseospira marina]
MAARIITIAQQKGGAGKTTLAAQLAVTWARRGQSVGLVDIDPQRSLASWHAWRAEHQPDGAALHLSDVAGWRLGTELDRLRDHFDVVVIDTPPHAETEARAAVRAGDILLLPVQPSPMDLWATRSTAEMAEKESTDALIVMNRMPPRGKLQEIMLEKLLEEGLPIAHTTLGNRVAFAASMMEGQGVVEYQPRSTAAREIGALATEVFATLKGRDKRR